jgi:CheY-like chemotaxis protein
MSLAACLPARLLIADSGRRFADAGPALPAPLSDNVLAELGLAWHPTLHQWAADGRRLRAALPGLLWQTSWRTRVCVHERAGLIVVLEPRRDGVLPDFGREFTGIVQGALAQAALARTTDGAEARPRAAIPPAVKTVVLVDDEHLVRSVCRRVLQEHYFVLEAAGAEQALALAEWLPWPADLLVSDINLPGIDGIELAGQWGRRWPSSRLLLLSGSFVPETAGELSALFLHKPFQADELLRCTEMLLGLLVAPKLPA